MTTTQGASILGHDEFVDAIRKRLETDRKFAGGRCTQPVGQREGGTSAWALTGAKGGAAAPCAASNIWGH